MANLYINQQDSQNSCNQTLFSIRCSTCFGLCYYIIRSNFISCTSHLVYADTSDCCVVVGSPFYNHTTARCIGIHQMRCTAYKVTPDNVLTESETCRASNGKQSNYKNFVNLVGLYTYCKMMHGTYNIKFMANCVKVRNRLKPLFCFISLTSLFTFVFPIFCPRYLCVSGDSHNKVWIIFYIELKDWFVRVLQKVRLRGDHVRSSVCDIVSATKPFARFSWNIF